MSLTRTKSKQKVKQTRTPITWKEIKRQKVLLFWAAIIVAYGVIFYYLPLAGWDVDAQGAVKDHLVADGDAAAGGGLQAGDHAQGGGLAAAGGAQQGDEGIVLNDQVQVVHGVELAPALGHMF